MSTKVKYNDSTLFVVAGGQAAKLKCKGIKMKGNIEIISDPDTNGSYAEGYEEGKADGKQAGYTEGFNAAVQITNDATATAEHIHSGYTAYVKGGVKVVGEAKTYDEGYDDGVLQGWNEANEEFEEFYEEIETAIIELNTELENNIYGEVRGNDPADNLAQVYDDFGAIKESITSKGVEVPDGTPTSEYADKVDEVYEAGKKSQYDEFWDIAQQNGNQKYFMGCFGGHIWTAENFKPKYDIVNPKNCVHMFYYSRMKIDLVEHLSKLGRKMLINEDNNCSWANAFAYSQFTRIGAIYSNGTSTEWSSTFIGAQKLVTIDEVGNYSGGDVYFTDNTFRQCDSLENIRVRGRIVKSTNFQQSTKLSKASWQSIIGCYAVDLTLSMTGSLDSVNSAFETSEGANDGSTSAEWLNLLATRPNLTVNLI